MKPTSKSAIFFLSALLILSGCKSKKGPNQQIESITNRYAKDFKPLSFAKDQRENHILDLADTIQTLFEAYRTESQIPGIAYGFVVDDQLVIDAATGIIDITDQIPASPTSVFRIASMTKSFTAMAILKLRDEGRLSLEDPAERYIPQMQDLVYLTSDAPLITIENLLTMTPGFPEDNPWGDRQLDESDTMLLRLMSDGPAFSNVPSYAYEYSNTGYALLGRIISVMSGVPYQDYITSEIILPLGMNDTYWEYDSVPIGRLAIGYRWEDQEWTEEPMLHHGSYGAMGGLLTTIKDFSKYVSFLLSAWPPRSDPDEGPVKRSSLREMQTPQFSRLFPEATNFKGDPCAVMVGYGFGLGVRQDCDGTRFVSHGGALPGFGSNYVFFPDYGIGLMAFCNLTYTSPWPFQKIANLLFGDTTLQPRSLPLSDILTIRKQQVLDLILTWDEQLEEQVLAENFYLDKSRAHRKQEIDSIFKLSGSILETGDMEASNQLRGTFTLIAENGKVRVFFTLSPERDPRVQRLDVSFEAK